MASPSTETKSTSIAIGQSIWLASIRAPGLPALALRARGAKLHARECEQGLMRMRIIVYICAQNIN